MCAKRYSSLAYKAATYVDALLEEGAIEPEASEELDNIYKSLPPTSSSSTSSADSNTVLESSTEESHQTPKSEKSASKDIILSKEAISKIVAEFHLPAHAEADLLRALEQTEQRLKSGESLLLRR